MASLDPLIVIAAAFAIAMSPLALGAWLTTRDTARNTRKESPLEPATGGAESSWLDELRRPAELSRARTSTINVKRQAE
jgi:hypothetical protein